MAITFPHLPDFADSFMQGASTAQGIFESMQKARLAKQQLKESETLLPARLQKYADEHGLTPYQATLLKAQAQEAQARAGREQASGNITNEFFKSLHENPGGQLTQMPSIPGQNAQFGDANATQGGDEGLVNFDRSGNRLDPRSSEQPPANASQAAMLSTHPMNAPNNPDIAQNQSNVPDTQTQSIPNDNAVALPSRTQDGSKKYPTELGETVVIKPPVRSEKWDDMPKMAGLPDFTPRREPIADGVVKMTYPGSGKVTLTKEAPSFEEKQNTISDMNEKKIEQQEKARFSLQDKRASDQQHAQALKEGDKIVDASKPQLEGMNLIKRAIKIMEENPNSTGLGSGFMAKGKISHNDATSALNEIFGKIQAAIGKVGSYRGGIQALGWAKNIKPSIFNNADWNLANLREGLAEANDDLKTQVEHYEKRTGQKFPLSLNKPKRLVWDEKQNRAVEK